MLISIIEFNKTHNRKISNVLIPRIVEKLDPEVCSMQMYKAYQSIFSPDRYPDIVQMTKEHISMINKK